MKRFSGCPRRCPACRLLFVPLFGVWLLRLFSLIFLRWAWRCAALCRLCRLFWRRRPSALLRRLATWLLRGVCGVLRARLFRGQAALALRAIWRRGRPLRCGVPLRRRSPLQQAWAAARARRLFSCCGCVFSCRLRRRLFQAALVCRLMVCQMLFQAALARQIVQQQARQIAPQLLFPLLRFFQAAYRLWRLCPRGYARLRLARRGVWLRARRLPARLVRRRHRFQAAPARQAVLPRRYRLSGCPNARQRVRRRGFQAALLVPL